MLRSLLRIQPFKGLYLTFTFTALLLVRIPVWTLLSLPASARPRPSWSVKRAVFVRVIRHFLTVGVWAGPFIPTPDYRAIKDGPNVNGVWLEPVPEELVVGKLKLFAQISEVKPIRLPGYWIFKTEETPYTIVTPVRPQEKILYHLHGGAYTRYSAHSDQLLANIPKGIIEHSSNVTRSFALEYRLSGSPPYLPTWENPFPTALLDALTGYYYLTHTLNIPPSQIIIVGDSAGGNLALALVRYLVEHGPETGFTSIPGIPGDLVLLSPWADMGYTHMRVEGASHHTLIPSDYLGLPEWADYSKTSFVGPLGKGALDLNAYISPASKHPQVGGNGEVSFEGFPPTFISCGGAEMLRDEIRTLRDRMQKSLGDNVTYLEERDAFHDFVIFTFHEPERTSTLKAIGQWIHKASL